MEDCPLNTVNSGQHTLIQIVDQNIIRKIYYVSNGVFNNECLLDINVMSLNKLVNVVKLSHFDLFEDRIIIYMDRYDGDLNALNTLTRQSRDSLISVFKQMIIAVNSLHQVNIIHGDICLRHFLWKRNPVDSKSDTLNVGLNKSDVLDRSDTLNVALTDFSYSIFHRIGEKPLKHYKMYRKGYEPPEILFTDFITSAADVYALSRSIVYLLLGIENQDALSNNTIMDLDRTYGFNGLLMKSLSFYPEERPTINDFMSNFGLTNFPDSLNTDSLTSNLNSLTIKNTPNEINSLQILQMKKYLSNKIHSSIHMRIFYTFGDIVRRCSIFTFNDLFFDQCLILAVGVTIRDTSHFNFLSFDIIKHLKGLLYRGYLYNAFYDPINLTNNFNLIYHPKYLSLF